MQGEGVEGGFLATEGSQPVGWGEATVVVDVAVAVGASGDLITAREGLLGLGGGGGDCMGVNRAAWLHDR